MDVVYWFPKTPTVTFSNCKLAGVVCMIETDLMEMNSYAIFLERNIYFFSVYV